MKPRFLSATRLSLQLASVIAALLVAPAAQAVIYYWDTNSTTLGLGNTAGTWGTSAFVATVGAPQRGAVDGTLTTALTATTTSDTIYFGSANLSLGAAASAVAVNGTQSIGNIVIGAAQANALSLTGGTITLAAAGSITNNASVSTTISSVIGGAGTSLTKAGAGTLILTGANLYTGTTIVSGSGVLQLGDGSTGSLNGATGTALTFNAGGGTFNLAKATAGSQGMGALTFSAGDGTITSTAASVGGTQTLTFASLAARAVGATGNFTLATNTTATDNKIVLTSTTNAPVNGAGSNNAGYFFGGTEYARYDTTAGYFRAVNYGTDTNASALIGTGLTLGIDDATKDVKITGDITAQTTAAVNTLNLGTSSLTLSDTAQILSVNGILSAGSGTAQIATAGKLQGTAAGNELVMRVNGSSDILTVAPIIQNFGGGGTASALTKSGAGTLILSGANTYTGTTTINSGILAVSGGSAIADTGAVFLANATGAGLRLDSNETISTVTGGGLSGGNVNLNGNTLTLADTTNNYIFDGKFTGTGGVVKTGTGTLTLTNQNTFAGSISVNAGALTLSYFTNEVAANTDYSVSSGGTINLAATNTSLNIYSSAAGTSLGWQGQLQSGSSAHLVSNNIVVTGGTGTATINLGGVNSERYLFTGSVTGGTSGAQTLAISQATNNTGSGSQVITFSGIIQNGSGGSTLGVSADFKGAPDPAVQSAWINLSGLNTFTGALNVANTKGLNGAAAGYLVIGGVRTSIGVTTGSGYLGGGNYTNTISLASGTILDYASSANQTLGGIISGGGSLLKEGSGTLTLSAANTYTGSTTVSAGTLSLTGSLTGGGAISTSGTGIIIQSGAGIISGASTFTQGSSGTNTLALTNTYTGGTTVSAGTLQLGTNNALGTGSVTVTAGTLQLGTFNQASGNVTLTGGTIDGSTGVLSGSRFLASAGTISAILGGSGDFYKSGTGTTSLTRINTFSGGTTVGGGTLAVGASATLGSNVNTNNITISDAGILTLAAATNTGSNQTITFSSSAKSGVPVSATGGGAGPVGRLAVLGLGFNGLPSGAIAQANTFGGVIAINGVTGYNTDLSTVLSGKNLFLGAIGTSTFTGAAGTVVAGNGSLYRLGGGGGQITFNTTNLFTSTNGVQVGSTFVNGGGTVVVSAAQDYSGATTVSAGTLILNGATGTATGSSGFTLNGGRLFLDSSTTNNADRIGTVNVALSNGGELSLSGNASGTAETFGNLSVGSGYSTVTVKAVTASSTLAGAVFSRTNNGTALFRGTGLGGSTAVMGQITMSDISALTASTYVGTNTLNNAGTGDTTKDLKIVTYLIGGTTDTDTGSTFVTYDTTLGFRALNTTNQFNTTVTAGTNVRLAAAQTGITTASINSLIIANTGTSTITDGNTLTVASGAILFSAAGTIAPATSTGILNFGAAEGIITTVANGVISTRISGSGGLTKSGLGQLTLSNASNSFSGGIVVNGGTLVAAVDANLGDASNTITVNGNATFSTGNVSYARSIILNNGSILSITSEVPTFSGNVTGTGGLAVTPGSFSAQAIFSGLNNTFEGPILIGGGGTGNVNYRMTFASLADSSTANGRIVFLGNSVNGATGSRFEYTGGTGGNTNLALNNRQIELASTIAGPTAGHQIMNSSAGTGTLTINTDLIVSTPIAQTLSLRGTNTGLNTFAGIIGDGGGQVSLLKTDAGRWLLSNANTFTGTTLVSGGILELTHSLALQNSSLNATSSVTGTTTAGLRTTVTALTLGGLSGTKDLSTLFTTTTGGYSGVTALTLNPGAAVTTSYSGVIANGAMTLTKTGAGTQTLTGANTYTGATTVNNGTLSLVGASGYKTTALSVASGATLAISVTGAGTSGGANGINTASAFNSVLAGITGSGVVTLNAGVGLFAGGGNNNSASMTTNLSAGAVLDVQTGSWQWGYGRNSALTNLGSLNVASGAEYRNSDTNFKFDALTGAGTVANAYTSAVTLTLGVSNTTNNATYGVVGNVATFSGVIKGSDTYNGVTTGALSVIKNGTGTQILTGTNTYTGATNVNAGKLVVNGSIATSSLTTVASGATIGGSGTVGALTVASGGFINPGNSPGILTVTSNYTQAGLYTAEITGLTAGTQHDQISMTSLTGTVNISGGSLTAAFTGGSYAANDLIFILLNNGVSAINGTYAGLTQGATVTNYGGFDWQISYVANYTGGTNTFTGGNDIALMAVNPIPEPRAALLGCLGALLLLRRRR